MQPEQMILPRFFIGGTGRSGTWILYRALGTHPEIHTFPSELRFLIDPGGLRHLINALTNSYSPSVARDALFRFERLMRAYLATPGRAPYAAINLPVWLGEEYYWGRLDQFCSQLVAVEYDGFSWEIAYQQEGRLVRWARAISAKMNAAFGKQVETPFESFARNPAYIREGKYFRDRKQLLSLANHFVDDLFTYASRQHEKRTWCEKTPQHLLHLDFIQELFPGSVFIHIKRDPRGVAYSLMKQKWGPKTLSNACEYLQGIYGRWFNLMGSLELNKIQYHEIKLEEFAESPLKELQKIMRGCGMQSEFGELPFISIERVNYWQNEMSQDEIEIINSILGPFIEGMGYQLSVK